MTPGTRHPLTGSSEWLLDSSVVHANHGSFGGVTRTTWDAVADARAHVAANPMRFFERQWGDAHARAVAAVTWLVGAAPGTLQLVPNATLGLDLALRVLPWRSGARVVRTDHAYPSVVVALDTWAARVGAEVVVVEIDLEATDDDAVSAVLSAAEGADGVVVDHVTSPTARWMPLDRIVAPLREAGTVVVVDAAHAPGQVVLDVASVGADAWVGNLHKWACAPPSLAAVVLDPAHHDAVDPLVHSAASGDLPFPDGSAWVGTIDPGPLLVAEQVVSQAAEILELLGDDITDRAATGARLLAEATGGWQPPGAGGWMRAIVLPASAGQGRDRARTLQDRIARGGVEIKVSAWRDHLVVRLSTHAYTTPAHHERVATVLADALTG